MVLAPFVRDLLDHGKLTVAGQVQHFLQDDLENTLQLLKVYWQEDKLEMPHTAPDFAPEAALWGAQYLYLAIQLSVLRHLGDEAILQYLRPYGGPTTAETIYGVDLCFRYLPDVLGLARGLAPADVLVQHLKQTALQWPFSSVGMKLPEEVQHAAILSHPSLRQAYIDRIISHRDRTRLQNVEIKELIHQALGDFKRTLWPDYELIQTD